VVSGSRVLSRLAARLRDRETAIPSNSATQQPDISSPFEATRRLLLPPPTPHPLLKPEELSRPHTV
jgi:hypothetical protein